MLRITPTTKDDSNGLRLFETVPEEVHKRRRELLHTTVGCWPAEEADRITSKLHQLFDNGDVAHGDCTR